MRSEWFCFDHLLEHLERFKLKQVRHDIKSEYMLCILTRQKGALHAFHWSKYLIKITFSLGVDQCVGVKQGLRVAPKC